MTSDTGRPATLSRSGARNPDRISVRDALDEGRKAGADLGRLLCASIAAQPTDTTDAETQEKFLLTLAQAERWADERRANGMDDEVATVWHLGAIDGLNRTIGLARLTITATGPAN